MPNIDISVQTLVKSSNSAGCHLEIKAVYLSVSPPKFVGNVNLLASPDRHLRDLKNRNSIYIYIYIYIYICRTAALTPEATF